MLLSTLVALAVLVAPDMHVGAPYSFRLPAPSGCPQSSFERQDGALPSGVTLSPGGLISGTPHIGGTYDVALRTQCSELRLEVYAVDPAPLVVRFGGFFPAVRGKPYVYDLRSTESGVLTWTVDRGALPPGLRLTNNLILGVPTVFGSFTFRVKVDDGRRTATRNFTLRVQPRFALVGKTLRLRVGHTFRTRVVVRGGVRPFQWSIARGKLPRGVRFVRGAFLGRPQEPGTSRVTIRVVDHESLQVTRTFTLVIRR